MGVIPPPPAPAEVLDEPAGAVPAGVEAAAEVVPPPVVENEVFFSFRFCSLVFLVFVFSATCSAPSVPQASILLPSSCPLRNLLLPVFGVLRASFRLLS